MMKRVLWIAILAIVACMAVVAQAPADTGIVAVAEQADAVDGMTASEEFQLRMRELELKEMKLINSDGIRGDLIPLVAIISTFLSPFLIAFVFLYYRNRKEQARYRVMEKAIESGRELPEGFFDEPQKKEATSSKSKILHQGVVVTAIGAGLLIWGFVTSMVGSSIDIMKGVGLIWVLIGVGKLIVYTIEERKEKSGDKGNDLSE